MPRPITKKDDIEEGAIRVVAERGLYATTIQDIARAADVSPGLLYRYWRNRDELAAQAYRDRFSSLRAALLRAIEGIADPWQQLQTLIRRTYTFADYDPVVFRFLLRTQYDLAPTLPENEGVNSLFVPPLHALADADRLRPIPFPLAMQLFVGLVLQPPAGVTYGVLAGPLEQYTDDVIATCETALLRKRPNGVRRK